MKTVKIGLGIYEHFKGKRYEVVGVGKNSETFEELVVYRALYGKNDLWVRPLGMFLDKVEFGGRKVLRFRYLQKI